MKKFLILLLLACCWAMQAGSQVLPPDFLCVRSDTLYWQAPVNACGPFVSYEVFASQNAAGPFNLVASITDPAQESFFFLNPDDEVWFFYLESNFNCPGQPVLQSDTLDNRQPVVSPIQSVTVQGNDVLVTWYPSPSPEVFAYVIYNEQPIGVVPVDTVFSGNTYLDTNVQPQTMSESYFVNALDRCGSTSIFDKKHSTIFLDATLNPCRQSITLTWNAYQNWPNGIGEQQIWVGENGAALTPADTIGPAETTYELGNLNDGSDYCIAVQAMEAGTSVASRSNEVCLTADIVQAVQQLYLTNVTVTPAGTVEVSWAWNPTAEIQEVQILRSSENANYQAVSTQPPPVPLTAQSSYADATASPGAGPVFYKIETRDDCDSVKTSASGATIFLTVSTAPGDVNVLTWTDFQLENTTVSSYSVFKMVNGTASLLATTPPGDTQLDDAFDATNLAEAQACYYVIAAASLTAPDGSVLPVSSRSNTACAEPDVRIYTPNALAPEGFNQEFRPLVVLGDIAQYEMRIFNRYGQEVFATNVLETGWTGKKNDNFLPQGAYLYFIRVTQASGKRTEKRGTVLLLR